MSMCVTYAFKGKLFIILLVHITAEEVFNNLNEFIASHDWLKGVVISTDRAWAMSEKLRTHSIY